MNKIIKRLSSYIDDNGNINNNVNQKDSYKSYNKFFNIKNSINTLSDDNLINNKNNYQYKIIDNIGLTGISFTNSKKEKIVIEFQLGRLTANSITKAIYQFNINIKNLSIKEQKEKQQLFNKQIYNNYFCGIIIVYINGNNDLLNNEIHYFSQDNSLNQLKQKGKELIDQIKNKYQ